MRPPAPERAGALGCGIAKASDLLPFPIAGVFVRRRRSDLLDMPGRPAAAMLPLTAAEVDSESVVHDFSVYLEAVPKRSSHSHCLNPVTRTEFGGAAWSGSIASQPMDLATDRTGQAPYRSPFGLNNLTFLVNRPDLRIARLLARAYGACWEHTPGPVEANGIDIRDAVDSLTAFRFLSCPGGGAGTESGGIDDGRIANGERPQAFNQSLC